MHSRGTCSCQCQLMYFPHVPLLHVAQQNEGLSKHLMTRTSSLHVCCFCVATRDWQVVCPCWWHCYNLQDAGLNQIPIICTLLDCCRLQAVRAEGWPNASHKHTAGCMKCLKPQQCTIVMLIFSSDAILIYAVIYAVRRERLRSVVHAAIC